MPLTEDQQIEIKFKQLSKELHEHYQREIERHLTGLRYKYRQFIQHELDEAIKCMNALDGDPSTKQMGLGRLDRINNYIQFN